MPHQLNIRYDFLFGCLDLPADIWKIDRWQNNDRQMDVATEDTIETSNNQVVTLKPLTKTGDRPLVKNQKLVDLFNKFKQDKKSENKCDKQEDERKTDNHQDANQSNTNPCTSSAPLVKQNAPLAKVTSSNRKVVSKIVPVVQNVQEDNV